mmetsp:Transcript_46675/g.129888  ORF Transcript_46675/g.129888 Transcript_46675/m.129888 type:complete len:316 (-) Transcript_46675:292-1239(-)
MINRRVRLDPTETAFPLQDFPGDSRLRDPFAGQIWTTWRPSPAALAPAFAPALTSIAFLSSTFAAPTLAAAFGCGSRCVQECREFGIRRDRGQGRIGGTVFGALLVCTHLAGKELGTPVVWKAQQSDGRLVAAGGLANVYLPSLVEGLTLLQSPLRDLHTSCVQLDLVSQRRVLTLHVELLYGSPCGTWHTAWHTSRYTTRHGTWHGARYAAWHAPSHATSHAAWHARWYAARQVCRHATWHTTGHAPVNARNATCEAAWHPSRHANCGHCTDHARDPTEWISDTCWNYWGLTLLCRRRQSAYHCCVGLKRLLRR